MKTQQELISALKWFSDLADAAYLTIGAIFIGILILGIYKAYTKWI